MTHPIWNLTLLTLLLCSAVVACGSRVDVPISLAEPAPAVHPSDGTVAWKLTPVVAHADGSRVDRIESINDVPLKSFAENRALDLLILGSGHELDYPESASQTLFQDIFQLVATLFTGPSPNLLGAGPGGQALNIYVTDHRYGAELNGEPAALPVDDETQCDLGLPKEWVPNDGEANYHGPAWDCNVALSTGNMALNLGLIIHRQPLTDRQRANLVSSEYNSFTTVLHELSHAAFAISDEYDGGGHFETADFPNVFRRESPDGNHPRCSPEQCAGRCQQISANSLYERCVDLNEAEFNRFNLMNAVRSDGPEWQSYRYYFNAERRRDFVWTLCSQEGKC